MRESYRVLKAEESPQNLLITAQSLSGVSDPKSTKLECKVILEHKTYWALLLEKGEEVSLVE